MTDQRTVLALECTDPIQIHTQKRTLTGIVYQCEHSEPDTLLSWSRAR